MKINRIDGKLIITKKIFERAMKIKLTTIILLLLVLGFSDVDGKNKSKQKSTKEFKSVTVYTTADSTNLRLSLTDILTFKKTVQPLETEISVFVNPDIKFQTFLGIGGAATDASAEVFAKLSEEQQEKFLTAYYDKENGIGYSFLRTNIHSCDFSSSSYTYVSEGDKELKSFSIEHDKQFRIPLIKKAVEHAHGEILIFASPWSPPAFMKDNNSMLRGGKLLPEYYQSWANYFTKFIEAYKKEGIAIWGITVQNEPMATQTWESCIFTAEEERDFLKNYLGPTMAMKELGDKKIIVWDHNRDLINHRANTIFEDPEASKYAWGIGYHWYETWAGGDPLFTNVRNVYESYPSKHLLFTEGCADSFDKTKYQFWPNAEKYGYSMINDFNNGTVAWTDWNILLDETGGPNHKNNFCFAPVHADTQTGELIFTPSFYYIGHFSKFIRPNSKRISTTTSRSHLQSTSFFNADGTMATVVMNKSGMPISYRLYVGSNAVDIAIPPHSIQTLVY